jgi:putative transcriptional regulator
VDPAGCGAGGTPAASCYPWGVSGSIAPALLVAMPQLLDPNFKRSVVLLVHHDDEGSFGLVVNRPSDIPARQLCENLDIPWRGDDEARLAWGGPVQPNTGWVLFGEGAPSDIEDGNPVAPGLSVAGSLDTLRKIARTPPSRLRLLLGYAGWGPHQLEDELAEGAWLLAPADPEVVFAVEADAMWNHVVRSLGIDPSTLVATPGVH